MYIYIFNLYKFGISVIHPIKKESIPFNFLGANCLSCENGYCHENQPVMLIVTGSNQLISVIYSFSR